MSRQVAESRHKNTMQSTMTTQQQIGTTGVMGQTMINPAMTQMMYPQQAGMTAIPQMGMPMPMMVPFFMPNMGMGYYPTVAGYGANPFGASQFNMQQFDASQAHTMNNGAMYRNTMEIKKEPKTKEEFIERFNKETLPILGPKRFIRLQAVLSFF